MHLSSLLAPLLLAGAAYAQAGNSSVGTDGLTTSWTTITSTSTTTITSTIMTSATTSNVTVPTTPAAAPAAPARYSPTTQPSPAGPTLSSSDATSNLRVGCVAVAGAVGAVMAMVL